MKIIDLKGLKCPMPLIETKKALRDSDKGESLKLLIDNDTSVKNVSRYLNDNGIPVIQKQNADIWELTLNKDETNLEETNPDEYCETPSKKNHTYVVVFAKNRVGEGSEELGQMLVGAMLESIKAQDILPKKMIFLNSGIDLVVEHSSVLPHLVELEVNGVEIVSCGTCLNYYGKSDKLAVGSISNMYDIFETMQSSEKLINV